MSKLHTTNYADVRGRLVDGLDPCDDTVVEYFNPSTEYMHLRVHSDDPRWQYLGVAPRPRTRWDWFLFDYHHGRLMRYPWLAVMRFSIVRAMEWNSPVSVWRREGWQEQQ